MTCNQCGAPMEEDAALCPACGAEAVGEAGATEPEAASPDELAGSLDDFAEEEGGAEETEDGGGGGETEAGEAGEAEEAGEAAELDEFFDEGETVRGKEDGEEDGEEDIGAEAKPPRRRRELLAFILSLTCILALGVGSYFLFFRDNSEEANVVRTFSRFAAAMEKGDIAAMRSFFPPGDLAEDEIPMFGTAEEMREGLETYHTDKNIDYSSDSAMVRSFVSELKLKLTLEKEGVSIVRETMSAILAVVEAYDYEGEIYEDEINFYMYKDNGKWVFGFKE